MIEPKSLHPAHCRCRKCEPASPADPGFSPAVFAFVASAAIVALLAAVLCLGPRIHAALFTYTSL